MTTAVSTPLSVSTAQPLRAGEEVARSTFIDLRREMAVKHCKWDPQVGDQSTLAAFPLVLARSHWRQLQTWAESLAAESMAAERELLASPASRKPLALPRKLERAISGCHGSPSDWPRIMRFDFHWTTDGWRISEANADVPGGLCEASAFTELMRLGTTAGDSPGDPAGEWAAVIARLAGERDVALLTAAGYMEDHQVMAYLAKRLAEIGVRSQRANPINVTWRDGAAYGLNDRPLGAIVRFFQAEWLTQLPARAAWRNYFVSRSLPVLNDATSLLIESKRFPLAWPLLQTPLPTWRSLLPETCDPRAVRDREGWIFKTAYCNTGDTVSAADWLDRRAWRAAERDMFWRPGRWIAQRRFETIAIDSPIGPVYPCIGVYTVAGRAAGIYGRLSRGPVIDFAAIDVAVLIEDDTR